MKKKKITLMGVIPDDTREWEVPSGHQVYLCVNNNAWLLQIVSDFGNAGEPEELSPHLYWRVVVSEEEEVLLKQDLFELESNIP